MSKFELSKDFSNEELQTKFNLVGESVNENEKAIKSANIGKEEFYLNFEKRMYKLEKNITEKIDESNEQIIKRVSALEVSRKIDEVKHKSSASGKLDIVGNTIAIRFIEGAVLLLAVYLASHIQL